ncbi:hypothetical protein [Lysobacter gummosus]
MHVAESGCGRHKRFRLCRGVKIRSVRTASYSRFSARIGGLAICISP